MRSKNLEGAFPNEIKKVRDEAQKKRKGMEEIERDIGRAKRQIDILKGVDIRYERFPKTRDDVAQKREDEKVEVGERRKKGLEDRRAKHEEAAKEMKKRIERERLVERKYRTAVSGRAKDEEKHQLRKSEREEKAT